jgi:hypothetical protein
MRRVEHLLVRLDDGAAAAILRVALGYVTGATWLLLIEPRASAWAVVPFFLAVLAALRVVPAVLRSIGRFSEPVRSVWSERRQMAKRHDSYQWQKLFWIGLGLLLHVLLSMRRSGALLALAVVCIVAGAMGIAAWRATGGGTNCNGATGADATPSGKGTVADVLTMGSKA